MTDDSFDPNSWHEVIGSGDDGDGTPCLFWAAPIGLTLVLVSVAVIVLVPIWLLNR